MGLELRQQLKLSQNLVMTPQLQQAIKLLQLSRLELLETVQTELMENPFLEEEYEEHFVEAEELRKPNDEDKSYENEVAKTADWEDYLGEFASTPKQMQHRDYEEAEEMTSLEARYTASPNLESHLFWQLRLSNLTEEQKEIGEYIIGNLSSSGYLQASLSELAAMAEVSLEEIEYVLKKIQLFDPIGVASLSPQECLLLQVKALGYDRDEILVSLITNHLEDLEAKKYKQIMRRLKIDMDDLREYLDVIQALDPMPGASFGEGDTNYISPDVYVYWHNEEFIILLNEDGLPHLQLSKLYDNNISNNLDKDYFLDKQRSASWLIKSLFQRQRTLRRVTESIVKYQHEFFIHGVEKLKPLILKDIADDVGIHESTVSRITTNKYVATPHGMYELKFFFNSALELEDGSQVGSESVKAVIKKCVAEEDPKDPLSDESISKILTEQLKVNIARRTVAKYRMSLDIPSSSRRKSHF